MLIVIMITVIIMVILSFKVLKINHRKNYSKLHLMTLRQKALEGNRGKKLYISQQYRKCTVHIFFQTLTLKIEEITHFLCVQFSTKMV